MKLRLGHNGSCHNAVRMDSIWELYSCDKLYHTNTPLTTAAEFKKFIVESNNPSVKGSWSLALCAFGRFGSTLRVDASH